METWCFLGILFSLLHNKADVYLRATFIYLFFLSGSRPIGTYNTYIHIKTLQIIEEMCIQYIQTNQAHIYNIAL